MDDLNTISLVGRLTRDAELKYTHGGMAIANLSLAVNRSVKSGDGYKDEASFFDCAIFGKVAECLIKYLVKGTKVGLTGSLRQERWEKDGQKQSKVSIAVDRIQLLDSQKKEGQTTEPPAETGPHFTDDIPF
jgi:single-strand DNA-binding protein